MNAPAPRAPIRLRRLGVHAVALVPEGANLIQWAEIRKALPMADAPLTLPRAAQELLITQLGKTVEDLLALLDMVKTATPSEDPAATVPAELGEALDGAGMSLMGLAEQFEPAGAGLEPGAQPTQMSAEEAGVESKLSLALAKAFKGLLRRSAAAMVAKSAGTGEGIAKAGPVKMTYEKALKLHSELLAKVYDMLKAVAPMFMAMDDAEPMAAALPAPAGAGGAGAPPAPAAAPEKKDEAALAKSLTLADLGAMLDAKLAPITTRIGDVEQKAEQISKGRPPPNSEPALGGEAPPATGFKLPYGANISEMVKKGKFPSDAETTTGGPAAAK